eukprot:TRINITY_DN1381_c0_g1_i1.p1 TRINITY_DN1381_c0_g1~~TRINITY_DN1381_c0_g1_i1.p1  ORF type:complete len:3672 (+),score=433.12 TRINITY_DN1381_c0_g1_i1:8055-19070(+)
MHSIENCQPCTPGKVCTTPGAAAESATSCSANHFCPEGSSTEMNCPAGTYTAAQGGKNEDSCSPCPPGSACPLKSASVNCAPGHYCLDRTYDPTETPCPDGTYTASNTLTAKSQCSDCNTPGKYCLEGSTGETTCELGYKCAGSKAPKEACPAGTYSSADRITCEGCPVGHICPAGYHTINPIPCPAGYFMSSPNSEGPCTECTAGHECPSTGMDTPTACPNGKWSLSGKASCDPCPAGYYCFGGVKNDCPEGYYCPSGSSSEQKCTAGYYCPPNSAAQLLCPSGKYSAEGAKECTDATAGLYTKQGTSDTGMATNACKAGYYCELGSKGSIHKPCPAGYYSTDGTDSKAACVKCTAGYYCIEGTSSTTMAQCPEGHYCEEGTAVPKKCPKGRYRDTPRATSETDCHKCPAGKVCSQDGLTQYDLTCDAGYYCEEGESTSQPAGKYCPEGSYCNQGAATPVSCPAGKFNVFKGCRSVDECLDCPFGFICSGTTGVNELCQAGSYCPGGTTLDTVQSAPAGYHTIQGQGDKIPCIPGTYTDEEGKSSCAPCLEGRFCKESASAGPSLPKCTVGHYCPTGTINPLYCNAGTFRVAEEAGPITDCTPCTTGKYCETIGLTSESGDCSPGFYCTAGAFHPKPAYTSNEVGAIFGPCPPGKYCPGGATPPQDCGIGKYSPASMNSQASDCHPCIPGKYCDAEVMTAPADDCLAGYFCPSESTANNANKCTVGHYCTAGTPQELLCPAGKYQNEEGKDTCKPCPEGKYCATGSTSDGVECPFGYYCPAETGDYKVFPCPRGTYGKTKPLTEASQCENCDGGYYCMEYGKLSVGGKCTAGYYCTSKATVPTPVDPVEGGKCTTGEICPEGSPNPETCPATYVCNEEVMSTATVKCNNGFKCGTGLQYKNPEGVSADSDFCDKGKWCQGGIQTSCLAGYYLPSRGAGASGGATECISCPYGHYCGTSGLPAPTGVCSEGYYCLSQQTSETTNPCSAGFSCPLGSIQEVPCQPGYYQTSGTQATCSECTAQNFCLYSSTLGTASQTACPKGMKCPNAGMDKAVACPSTEYQDENGKTSCKSCIGGKYCDRYAMEAQSECPAGYYCTAGQISARANICTPGHYCPAGSSDELPCPAGKYCADYGLSEPTGTCSPGYYCITKATVPNPTDVDTGNICPAGHYCPDGKEKKECAAGTYNELQGSESAADCLPCLAGKKCTTAGLTYPLDDCPAGKHCPEGGVATDCTIGYMCPAGYTEEVLCLPGTYQDQPGKDSCLPCPAGKYCNFDGGITVAKDCPKGYYCPALTADYLSFPCPEGKYNPDTGKTSEADCILCTEKFYCPKKAQFEVTDKCENGYTCPAGSKVLALAANLCPKNSYCIEGTIYSCPASTYTYSGSAGDVLGATEEANCMKCLPGKLCPNHDTGIQNCPAGKYCVDGVDNTCTTKHYCPANSFVPLSCARGTYSGSTGAITCTQCPDTKYCDEFGMDTPKDCTTNMICTPGSVKPSPCDYGKYPDGNVCKDCPPGRWCWRSKINNDRGDCSNGYICSSGSRSPTPFYPNLKNSTDPALNSYNGPAAKGCYTHNSLATKTTVNTKCPAGTYMPSMGADSCIPCPPGHYCDTDGIFDVVDKICTAGHICISGSITPTPTTLPTGKLCDINHYCPGGTSYAIQCPEGTMALVTGKATCEPCDEGYTCTTSAPYATCATGNTKCVVGTGVEPLCPPSTYRSGAACVPCPSGLFCIDGRSEPAPSDCSHGQCCTAGYLCTGGSATPMPVSNGGYPCETGYYCPEGTTSMRTCPPDLYIFSPGKIQESDCTPCMEGYVCTQGNPLPDPCPSGNYCPTGITGWTPCPIGTASKETKQKIVHECESCPAGYLCKTTGISDYSGHSCPKGNYCFERALSGIQCPYGTYNNKTGAKSTEDCDLCPAGYYCPELGQYNATKYSCYEGQLCETGTVHPPVCPGGYYCNNATGYQKALCPVNNYCPPNSSQPIPCSAGETCPAGSKYPIKCVAGQISKKTEDGVLVCQTCPPGTYSVSGLSTRCETCEPGFVCLGGTNAKFPWSVKYHKGYKCPQGAYCPAGSAEPTLCPVGTYNAFEGEYSATACMLCKANTFNPWEGQSACLPCGDSATSEQGWATCSCKGKNRAFLISDSSCRCKPGYQYLENGAIQSDVNSKVDCQPIIYKRCKENEIRGYDGVCRGNTDCASACDGGQGIRSPTLGICECKSIQRLDKVCNKACREALPKVHITSDGLIRINKASDPYNYEPAILSPQNLTGFNTEYMSCPKGKECSAKPIRFANSGRITASYGLSPRLGLEYQQVTNPTKRLLTEDETKRLLAEVSSTEIMNPVMCIHEGDTAIFEIDGNGHYPVYQKDSLLNSNPDFDYGPFKILSERISAQLANGQNTPQYFGYTFSKSGRYFFADSIDPEKTLVVYVTKESEKCPNEGAFLQPRTSGSLSVFGLALNETIMLEPDYVMMAIILVTFVLSLGMLLVLMKWVTEHMWKAKDTSDPLFRENQKFVDVKSITMAGTNKAPVSLPVEAANASRHGIFKDVERPGPPMDNSFIAELAEGINLQKLEELDPFIIEKILKDYQGYKDYLQKELLNACEKQSKQIEDLNNAIDKLKFLLNERYEKLIALLKLDVDYTKLSNVKIKMEEEKEEGKKRDKRVKPSDIKLAKSEEKKAADVLKQIIVKKNEANIINDIYEEDKDTDNNSDYSPSKAQVAKGPEDIEEKIKKTFEKRLEMMGDLTDFEKEKLRDELASELINLEYVLAGEREEQEIAIRKMLQARRKKNPNKPPTPIQVDLEKLSPEEVAIKEKVEQQIEDEARDRARDIEQRALGKIQKAKEKLLNQLGAPSNLSDKEKDIILSNHKTELEQLFETIQQDKEKQLDDLQARLAKRKQAKVAEKIKELREELHPEIPVEESAEQAVEIPASLVETKSIEKLKDEEQRKLKDLERVHAEEKNRLLDAHVEEFKEKEGELEEDLQLEVEKEMELKKEKVEEKFRIKQQDIEDQRRKLKDKLLFSGGDKEASQKLLEEVKTKDEQIRELMEQEKKEQEYLLEEKINRRRIAKQKKILAFKNAQHDIAIEVKLKQLKEKHEVQGKYETERIKEIIRRARDGDEATQGKLYQMFEQLWNEKEAIELANMFGRQLAEKESKLRAAYKKSMEQKLMEKKAVKDRYKALYDDLEIQKVGMNPDDYAARHKELRVEEENDLKEMDIKESMNQKKEEFALRQDLEEKVATEIGEMQDKLAEEKLAAMKELFGNQRQEEVALNNRMREMKESIEREKDRKIKEIELEKKILLEKYENEMKERFNSYEDILKKQRETEKLIKEKKGNIGKMLEERKKQIAELKDKALFTPEQEKQLLDKYQQELKALESAMEGERNRQFAKMQEKLEQKKGQREREQSYHKKKVAFLMGTVGKNVTLAQAVTDKIMKMTTMDQPKNELERAIERWKKDMEEREKSQKTTTFETLQKYLENVGKFKKKGLEGIYLQGMQYQKYLQLMKASKILQKKLEELHRIKASGVLLDLKAALKVFAEDDFDRLKARPERIGGGFRCFDNEGNILWDLFKFIHSQEAESELFPNNNQTNLYTFVVMTSLIVMIYGRQQYQQNQKVVTEHIHTINIPSKNINNGKSELHKTEREQETNSTSAPLPSLARTSILKCGNQVQHLGQRHAFLI